jgi:hypothetical protein
MPGDTLPPASSSQSPQTLAPESLSPNSQTPFNIGEEYGTARKSLPPVKIVLSALVVVATIAAIFVLTQRPHSEATGSLGEMTSVGIPGQNTVMVALNVSIHNGGEKFYWIKSMQAALETDTGRFTDEAAPASDFERYFQAFPALKEHALSPLTSEAKIEAGAETSGTMIVSFPVTADAFAKRKSLIVTIQPYDQAIPLVLKK